MRPDFFVIGCERSGTTLARLMLNAHPQIVVPRESYFITQLYKWSKAQRLSLENPNDYERYIVELCKNGQFRIVVLKPLGLDEEAVRDHLLERRLPSQSAIYDAVFSLFAKNKEALLVGDKTPRYSVDLDIVHSLFPKAKYIFVIRDGRSVYASLKRVEWHWLNKNSVALSRQWHYCMEMMETYIPIISDNLHIIRYEEMAREPEQIMRKTCAFLEVPYEPQMLDFHKDAVQEIHSGGGVVLNHHKRLQSPVNTDAVAAWQTELSDNEVLLFELLNTRHLRRWGYPRRGTLWRLLNPAFPAYLLKSLWEYRPLFRFWPFSAER